MAKLRQNSGSKEDQGGLLRVKGGETFGDRVFPYLAISPAVLLLVIVLAYPAVHLIIISLQDYNLMTMNQATKPFAGLKNYTEVFSHPEFWNAFGNTMYFVFVGLGAQLIFAIILALVVSKPLFAVGFSRSLIMVPWMTSFAATSVMWAWLLEGSFGLINSVMLRTGLIDQPILWLGTTGLTMNVIVFLDTWREVPVMTMMLVAGLQAIEGQLYEAARIDGASSWQMFWRITMPLLLPVIILVLTLRTMISLRVFDLVQILTGGGPAGSTEVLATLLYRKAFSAFNFGSSAAISVFLFALTLGISLVYIRLLTKPKE